MVCRSSGATQGGMRRQRVVEVAVRGVSAPSAVPLAPPLSPTPPQAPHQRRSHGLAQERGHAGPQGGRPGPALARHGASGRGSGEGPAGGGPRPPPAWVGRRCLCQAPALVALAAPNCGCTLPVKWLPARHKRQRTGLLSLHLPARLQAQGRPIVTAATAGAAAGGTMMKASGGRGQHLFAVDA